MAKVEMHSCSLITETHIKPDNEVLKIIPQSPAKIKNTKKACVSILYFLLKLGWVDSGFIFGST